MSFLSRRPSRSGNRDSEAGRDAGYDDYDYAPDGYARGDDDDSWSANEYFSPEGIKGRRPAARQPGDAGYDEGDSFQGGGTGGFGTGGFGTGEYATGAFALPDVTDDDRGSRKRKERGGRLRLRRDKGEDIWPDDGVSDEDYWASVAADRPLTPADAPPEPGPVQAPSEPRGGTGRLGPAPGLVADYQPASAAGALRRSAPQRSVTSSGGLPRADTTQPAPSFSPNGRQQDRPDWGERTERIDRVTATGYPDPRASDRGWPADGRNSTREPGRAPGHEDPLTSTAYSRSALADADGRSYRAATRRSQEQARLEEQTQAFGVPVSYPGPVDRYPGDRYPSSQRPSGRAQTGEQPTVRYPAYGSQQPGQRGGHSGQVNLPGASSSPTGPYPPQQPRQPRPPQQPPLPTGGNPYDSAVTGSYPYPGQAGYPARSPQPPQEPDPNARDDRPRRPAPPDGYGRY